MILGIGAEMGILTLIIFILILIIIFIKGFKLTQSYLITKEERTIVQFLFFSFITISHYSVDNFRIKCLFFFIYIQ